MKSGATLLRIESPSVQAQLLEADRELEALRTQFSAVSSQQDQHYGEQIENLKARAKRAARPDREPSELRAATSSAASRPTSGSSRRGS